MNKIYGREENSHVIALILKKWTIFIQSVK